MPRLIALLLYLLLLITSVAVAVLGVMSYLTLTRGVEPNFPTTEKVYGTNVAVEQYESDEDFRAVFGKLQDAHLTMARQYFPWREIEAQQGVYDWAKWDRIIKAAHDNGIQLVAVLDTAPVWSQRPNEVEMPNAPPDDFAEYARFVGDFAKRYGDTIDYYQIWDEPNVEPNWGQRNADPVEYAQMLMPAAQAVRAADPNAKIVLAGLAMNLELHRPHPNYSEILFLRGLYEIGAEKYFDIVAAKPYGMWTGPEDRTTNSSVLNFSRLILLRDEMLHYGDASKPIWAVEMGWNALPADWKGPPSPWGTDTETIQADRLVRGLARAQNEWAWLTAEFPLYLQPNVPADNPRRGFALLTPDFEPRLFYDALAHFVASPPARVPLPSAPVFPILLLAGVALVSAWRAWHFLFALQLDERWQGIKTRVRTLPAAAQFLMMLAVAAAFYFSPNTILNFALLVCLVLLFALRIDFAIALTVFSIPFWNFPKALFGGFELSPVEVLTWAAGVGFVLNIILSGGPVILSGAKNLKPALPRFWRWAYIAAPLRMTLAKFSTLDWAVLVFLLLGLVSTWWAGNFGVASREFRIVVFDPILLYALVRLETRDWRLARWIVNALFASGVAVCLIGFYQYVSGDVILADGIARLTAVWGSPNNVGLYLGRLLPIALAFVLLWQTVGGGRAATKDQGRMPNGPSSFVLGLSSRYARLSYGLLLVLFAVTILLTYSRGALFLGVPAAVLFVLVVMYLRAHHLSRRAWLAIGAAAVVAGLALVPFLTSDRFLSLFQEGTGTGFFRIAVWTSAVQMLRDHPLLGVGLDNFLYEYPKYILPEAWREPNLSHPHNFVLDFWLELGIGGVAILVWMLVAFFKQAWRAFTTTNDVYVRALMLGLMASMIDMLAHGLIDAAYFVVDLAYIFMLTLALVQSAASPANNLPSPNGRGAGGKGQDGSEAAAGEG